MIINGGRIQGTTLQDQLPYVATGLVEYLDALDYSGAGATWTAHTGSNSTLQNSPAYTAANPAYFTFTPASSQWSSLPNLGNFTSWTVEAWFRASIHLNATDITSVVTTVFDDPGGPHPGTINYALTNFTGTAGVNDGIAVGFYNGDWHLTNFLTVTPGTWYQVVGTYDGTDLKQYNNGTLASTVAVGSASSANGGETWIARRWDGAVLSQYLFPGDIAIVRIYNTALTSGQVTQNWSSTRGRFGL